jgi:Uma2 family endonuclease
VEVEVTRRLFSVDEYLKMIDAGILGRADHVELIDGDILQMAPIGPSHASCVAMLNRRLVIGVADRGLVVPQLTLPLDPRSALEPDLAVLRPREVPYRETWARPQDVLLLIEVSDTPLRYDREVKAPLYARAGIHELWIVDLPGERVLVHRNPRDGEYRTLEAAGRGSAVAPLALPRIQVAVDEVFG